jgi:predicted DNA binding CopG/RHH family protein
MAYRKTEEAQGEFYGNGTKGRRITVLVSQDDFDEIKQRAIRKDTTISNWCRIALHNCLSQTLTRPSRILQSSTNLPRKG